MTESYKCQNNFEESNDFNHFVWYLTRNNIHRPTCRHTHIQADYKLSLFFRINVTRFLMVFHWQKRNDKINRSYRKHNLRVLKPILEEIGILCFWKWGKFIGHHGLWCKIIISGINTRNILGHKKLSFPALHF